MSSRLDRVAEHVVDVAAVAGLVVVAVETTADPTTVVGAIAGLGGFRMHQRPSRPVQQPQQDDGSGSPSSTSTDAASD